MTSKTPSHEPEFGINTVSQLTGISQHLLRIWEKRYQLVEVPRSATGRRVYSKTDVDRLLLIKHLVDQGEAISKVANLSVTQLQNASVSLRDQTQTRSRLQTEHSFQVAVLGDFLPVQLKSARSLPERLEFVIYSTSMQNFRADIQRLRPDALVWELAVFNQDSAKVLKELLAASGARVAVIVYGFGRSDELEALRAKGIRTVRSPTTLDQVYAALLQEPSRNALRVSTGSARNEEIPEKLTAIPGRRFGAEELAKLASASATVECECPAHLVELVISLSAFEAYSAACESKNDKDAALHAYLHATTASARASLEEALERVAHAEGLL